MENKAQATAAVAPRAAELLAPAGGPEAAYAAFQYGADAVYCGLRKFSARAEAINFSVAELDALTAFAHAQTPRRRVFVTINTVTRQAELPALVETLAHIGDTGVDAVIIQDLGVAHLVRQHFPRLEMHASTQMAIHNVAGARQAKALGFARVTLARELTLDEVRRISADAGVETEVFIHGALCYAYSGLCFFSSHVCGRSGNRGRCSYPCRDLFTQVTGKAPDAQTPPHRARADGELLFSMKDLALPGVVCDLRKAGVACFKIEGRMKSPLYVAAVTDFYRRILDGRMSAEELPRAAADLQTIFSRPWTELYLKQSRHDGVVDAQWVGHRGVLVGKVEKVIRPPHQPPLLRFTTTREIELHDGLQIDVPGTAKPFGFPVDELRLPGQRPVDAGGRRLFAVAAGEVVDVPLPADAPPLPAGATVYCASSQAVKKRFVIAVPKAGLYRRRRELRVTLEFGPGSVSACGSVNPAYPGDTEASATCSLQGEFSPARQAEGLEPAARGAFSKLGDTALELATLELRNPQNLFVPVSQLNELRRQLTRALATALEAALNGRIAAVCAALGNGQVSAAPAVPESWAIHTDNPACLASFQPADWAGVAEVVLDVSRVSLARVEQGTNLVAGQLGHDAVRLALPVLTRAWEEPELQQRLLALAAAGWCKWQAANLSAFQFLETVVRPQLPAGAKLDVTADWTLFVLNSLAAKALEDLGITALSVSPEDGRENLCALLATLGNRLSAIVYQDTPLFVSESCAFANQAGRCAGPARCRIRTQGLAEPGSNAVGLRAGKGGSYLLLSDACRSTVVSSAPFCLSAHLAELRSAGARRFRVDFVHRHYPADVALDVWRRVRRGLPVTPSHDGNFGRSI